MLAQRICQIMVKSTWANWSVRSTGATPYWLGLQLTREPSRRRPTGMHQQSASALDRLFRIATKRRFTMFALITFCWLFAITPTYPGLFVFHGLNEQLA